MDDNKLGWTVQIGLINGVLRKIDFDLGRFWVDDHELPGFHWPRLEFKAPPQGLFVARSGKVSMVVTKAERDILARAGAAFGK